MGMPIPLKGTYINIASVKLVKENVTIIIICNYCKISNNHVRL